MNSSGKKDTPAIKEVLLKLGYFERAKPNLKMLSVPSQWGQDFSKEVFNLGFYRSKGCKITRYQSWSLENKFCRPARVKPQAWVQFLDGWIILKV